MNCRIAMTGPSLASLVFVALALRAAVAQPLPPHLAGSASRGAAELPSSLPASGSILSRAAQHEETIEQPAPISEEVPWSNESEASGLGLACPDCKRYHGLGKRCGGGAGKLFGLFRSPAYALRATGKGQPLEATSWLNRPYSIGLFLGLVDGDPLIRGRVNQGSDLFGGVRLGWDYDYYWGIEGRLAWAGTDLTDNQVPPRPRTADVFLGDLSFLYYPWGDSAWRPYFQLGLGVAHYQFLDEFDVYHSNALLGVPFGFGLKYYFQPTVSIRAEVVDNFAAGAGGISSMHNVSFTLGLDWRYGGKRKSYYPWHPSRHIW